MFKMMRFIPVVNVNAEVVGSSENVITSASSDTSATDLALTTTADTNARNFDPDPSGAPDPQSSFSEVNSYSLYSSTEPAEIVSTTYTGSDTSSTIWSSSTSTPDPTSTNSPISTTTATPISSSTFTSTSTSPTPTSTTTSPTQSTTSDPSTFSGGTSKTTKIAIAVPVSVIGFALILALIFILARRRRRNKERTSLPPPYHVATGQTTAPSTQQLMSPKTTEPRPPMTMTMPIPLINVSSSSLSRRSPSPTVRNSQADSGSASQAELGTAIAVPVSHRRSATEEELGVSRQLRMPFEDFEDDEVGIGPVESGRDDDAVSDVSDGETRGKRRDFDEVSEVSFHEVSPISPTSPEQRRFR